MTSARSVRQAHGRSAPGLTLIELMVSVAISALIIFGIVALESARVRQADHFRDDAAVKYPSRHEADLALLHLIKELEAADRYCVRTTRTGPCLTSGGGSFLQVRRLTMGACAGIPRPDCFDDDDNYQWDQYQLQTASRQNGLEFHANTSAPGGNCSSNADVTLVQEDISAFTVSIPNAAEPHILQVALTWLHPADVGPNAGLETGSVNLTSTVILRSRSVNQPTGQPNQNVPNFCP